LASLPTINMLCRGLVVTFQLPDSSERDFGITCKPRRSSIRVGHSQDSRCLGKFTIGPLTAVAGWFNPVHQGSLAHHSVIVQCTTVERLSEDQQGAEIARRRPVRPSFSWCYSRRTVPGAYLFHEIVAE